MTRSSAVVRSSSRTLESTAPLFRRIGTTFLLCCWAAPALGQTVTLGQPLPLEVVVDLRGHNARSPINLSPNGEWIAHTIETVDRVPRDSAGRRFSTTGFPFGEGDARMEATLSNGRTGEVVRLGSGAAASWAPVWSPDGARVAFYSDEGGTAGLWIWEAATRKSTRIPGLIVRPFFGFETVEWTADGQRLIVKALPSNTSIAEANRWSVASMSRAVRFPEVGPDEASVFVRRVDPTPRHVDSTRTPKAPGTPARVAGEVRWTEADLALVDLRAGSVQRLVEHAAIRAYALSPDGKYLAYTVLKGWEENSQQPSFDLIVREVGGGASRTLAKDLRIAYGIEWSWSPDSRSIAVISSGGLADGKIALFPIAGGAARTLNRDSLPSFDPGDGEYPPLWDGQGKSLYAVGGGALYRVDAGSGRGSRVAQIPGWKMTSAVWSAGRPVLWTTAGGRTAWVIAREDGSSKSGIFAVDLATGRSRSVLQESASYLAVFNLAASDATGEIAFVSSSQQQLAEIRLLDTKTGAVRRASHINATLDRYPLGIAKIIDWRTADGQPLKGTLLLPPGYRPGLRLPLVVWVYGGAMGSEAVNRFGLWGDLPNFNMHVLATRGYAVLYPDTPLRQGMAMADLLRTVIPGVDAAIEQGYADPDRLAVMGQSYGSYCTLALITQTTRFKAAVITAAVLHPDLVADYFRNIGYYENGQGNMGGSIWEQKDRYLDNSPLFRFDRIETPLLIGQGDRDGNLVPSDAIFAALERLGKPVEYRLYQGEDHVISRRPNVIDFWQRRLAFLAQHLDLAVDSSGAVLFEGGRAKAVSR